MGDEIKNALSDLQGKAMSDGQIENIFGYHAPRSEQFPKYEAVNAAFLACAKTINEQMPCGAGATSAIRKLADARMAANAAIALEGKF